MEKAKPEVVFQVGMVVRDAEEKVRALKQWFDFDEDSIVVKDTRTMTEQGIFHDNQYLGKPAEFYIKTIRLSFGGIDFEYIEPLNQAGGDPFSDWLLEHGEGIHHICYEVEDIHAALEQAKERLATDYDQPKSGAGGSQVFFLDPKSCCHVETEFVQPAAPPRA